MFKIIKKFVKPSRRVKKVFIHCSASDNAEHDNPEIIERWHLENGWSGIGYHYYIDNSGKVFECRSSEKTPAAQGGHNAGTLAICCGGLENFSDLQFEALRAFCEQIDYAYEGHVSFHGHCEVSNKECPVFDYRNVLRLDDKGFMKHGVVTTRKLRTAGSRTIKSADIAENVGGVIGGVSAAQVLAKSFEGTREIVDKVKNVNGVISDAKSATETFASLVASLIQYWPFILIICAIILI